MILLAGIITIALFLSACGGGGSGGVGASSGSLGNGANPQTDVHDDAAKNRDDTVNATRNAVEASPKSGSVTQTNVILINNRHASVVRNGDVYTVTVPTDGGSVALTTRDNFVNNDSKAIAELGNNEVETWTLVKVNENIGTTVAFYATDGFGEWASGGYWITVIEKQDDSVGMEIGAFFDGPDVSGTPTLPTSGSAVYNGLAAGLYMIGRTSNGRYVTYTLGDYEGKFKATASFSNSGTKLENAKIYDIQSVSNIWVGGLIDINGSEIILGNAEDTNDENIYIGDVTSVKSPHNDYKTSGQWGSKFSTIVDKNGIPTYVGGTHGAYFNDHGFEGAFIGTHGGLPE